MQVHLFDGTYELFRAWFGAPPAQHAGREVGATRSVMRSLAMLIGRGTVTHLGVAFDHVIESFRNDLFDGYKTGEGIDERLVSQFELVERATAAMGVMVWPMVEFEADDAIATGAAALAGNASVDQVRIVSPDKDMCQCVGPKVVCWERFKDIVLDEPAVVAKHGVSPASIPDLLALVGDTADGIPGLEGWGKSSAAKVLTVYKHIEAIPDDVTKWNVPGLRGMERLAGSLRDQRAEAMLYRKLATLRTDCPITTTVEALAWKGVNRPALDAILAEIGMSADSIKL